MEQENLKLICEKILINRKYLCNPYQAKSVVVVTNVISVLGKKVMEFF